MYRLTDYDNDNNLPVNYFTSILIQEFSTLQMTICSDVAMLAEPLTAF